MAAFRALVCARFVHTLLLSLALFALALPAAQGAGAICAQVKIEIQQKVSLERQAFDAKMSIDNGLDTPVQNVAINLNFSDAGGKAVVASSDPNNTTASFFIGAPTLSAINAIDGSGSVAPKTSGVIDWLLIPAQGTGGTQPQGKLYLVGATLSYTIGNDTKTVDVAPETITVLPQPLLTLDYFLAGDVYADDAFTPEVEPPVPFTLGVRVKNTGGGAAKATTIESAQPKIIDNSRGLAIAFQILDGYVGDQPTNKTLLLNFGDIAPASSKVGRWNMVTALSGKFVEFNASFTHADSLGGALTSLIQAVNTHLLVHDVKVDLPGRDAIRDFLALDGSTLRVYESGGIDTVAIDQSASAQLQPGSGSQFALSFPATTGFAYVTLPDPKAGQVQPGAVLRSDGKSLPPENVWLSKKRNPDTSWAYSINFFDVNTTGRYDVTLAGSSVYGSIAGTLYSDANNNGVQDNGETGIGAVAVTLTGTDNQGVSVNTIGYTDQTGAFKFVQLNPGTYAVQVAAIQNYLDGTATPGSAGGTVAVASITNIVLGSGSVATGYAFAKRYQPGGASADLAVTMTSSVGSVKVNDSVSFQVVVKNNGPSTATATSVTDLLPNGLSFVASATTTGSYNSSTGVWSVGDLANAASATLTLNAKATKLTGLTNMATATSTVPDPNSANNSASVTLTPIAGNSTLTINILESDYRVAPGDVGTLLATVNNYGPDAATGVTIALTPTNMTVASALPAVGTYDATARIWTIDTLPNGASANLILRAANVGNLGALTANVAQVNGAAPAAPVQGKVTLNPFDCGCADLSLKIVASMPTASIGTAVDWVITASNRGANPAGGTLATIPIPASLTLVSAQTANGNFDANSGQWSIGTLHPGDSVTLTLHTSVNASTPTVMNGSILAANADLPYADLTLADNSAQASVNAPADTAALRVSQIVDKMQSAVGDTVTLTLTAANDGPLAATGVAVIDVLPAGLTFVSATPSRGAYDAPSGVWAVGALDAQANATLTIQATVGTVATLGNAALIYANQIDSAAADNVARLYLNSKEGDAAVTLAADNLSSTIGQTVVVTVSAKDWGVDDAAGVVISAPLPPGLSLTSANAAQGSYDAGTGLWKLGSLAANATSTLTLTTKVNIADPFSFVARVHETLTHEGNTANNEAQLGLNTPPQAALAATVSTDQTGYQTGDSVTVTAVINNSGNATSQTIAVTMSVTNSAGAQVHSAGQTIATLAAGAGSNLTFPFSISGDTPGTYTVTVQGSDAAGNTIVAVQTTYTLSLPQASLTGWVFNDVNADNQLDVNDVGLAGVTVTLSGADSHGAAVDATTVTGATGGFVFSQLNAGTYAIQATAATAAGFTNTVAIAGSAGGAVAAGNIGNIVLATNAGATDYLFAQRTLASYNADVRLSVTSSNPQPFYGDSVTLTLSLTNAGPAMAPAVSVAALLPTGLTFISAVPSAGSYDGVSGAWSVGDLPNGASASLAIVAQVNTTAPLTFTPTASSSAPDASGNNSTSFTFTASAAADVGVTLSASNTQPIQNTAVALTIAVTNAGPSTAAAVVLSEQLPAGLTFVSAIADIGSYDSATGVWTIGNLAAGASSTLTLNAVVNTIGVVTNTVIVSSTTADPNSANNTAGITLAPSASADLGIAASASNLQPAQNSNVTLTISVNNAGPSTAVGTTVLDPLPAGLSYVSSSTTLGSYNSATGVWAVGDLASGANATLTLTAKVTSTGATTNTASVTSAINDPDMANNSASVALAPAAVADIGVSLAASSLTPALGDALAYTITVNNAGPSTAAATTVTDLLPAGLTYVSATTANGSFNPSSGVWSVGDMASGAFASLTLNVKVNATGALTNTVSAASAAGDPNPANNTASVAVNATASADVGVALSTNNVKPNIGDTFALTITASNAGPSPAAVVSVTNAMPAGMSFVSAITTTGSYDSSTGVWTVGSLANAASATLTINAKITTTTALTDTATVTASTNDPNTSNNTASLAINAVAVADLAVSVAASNANPKYGDTIALMLAVNNAGPSTAAAVTVTDLLPGGLSFVSASTATGSFNSASGVWTLGGLANGASATLTINVKVASANTITNTASVSSTTNDANLGNNTANVTLTPIAADVGLSMAASNATPAQNDTIVLTITAGNAGPSKATAVAVTNVLPAGLTFVSATTATGSYKSNTGVWTVGDLVSGASATLAVSVKVASVSPIAPSASATTTAVDPNPANNTASITLKPVAAADLAVSVSVNNTKPGFGDNVVFTVKVNNSAGPSAAGTVSVTDLLPAGLTYVSASATAGSYTSSSGIWAVGDLAMGANATLTLTAKVATVNALTNTASVSSATFDPNAANNTANVTLTPAAAADLGVTVNASVTNPVQNNTVVLTIAMTNAGPSTAAAVTLTDKLPSGLTFVSDVASVGTYKSSTGVWSLGDMANGATATLAITARVTTATAVTNTATLNSATADPNSANNTASVTLTPVPAADLAVSISANSLSPQYGSAVVLTITLKNAGPAKAIAASVTDVLPAGLNFVSATTATGSYNSTNGVWSVGDLANGASATLKLTATVATVNPVTDTASLNSTTVDPNNANGSASVTLTPPPAADLAVALTASALTPNYGDTVSFTVTASNAGPSPAAGVSVADILPSGLTFVSATTVTGTFNGTSGSWTVGNLANGAVATLTINAKVATVNPVTNKASITSTTFDWKSANNSATVTLTPLPAADIGVTLAASSLTPKANTNIVLTVKTTNNGPSPATAVVVTDKLPAGLTFVSATTTQGSYTSSSGTWTVGNLAKGRSATLKITATVLTTGAITDTVTVVSATFDQNAANNSASVTLSPAPAKDSAKPGVNLDVQESVVPDSRVLVMVSCEDAGGTNDPACVATKADFLASYLGAQGLEHQIVSDPAEFQTALRCGRFNTYWISGASAAQIDGFAAELQEAVYRGDGLLVEGVAAANPGFETVLGAHVDGTTPVNGASVNVTGSDFTPASLAPPGAATQLQITTGAAQAGFSGSDNAALVVNQFGLGRSVTMGFDLLGSLRAEADSATKVTKPTATLLANAFQYVLPADAPPYTGGGFTIVTTAVRNIGDDTKLELIATLPEGATLDGHWPATSVVDGRRVSLSAPLAAGKSQLLDLGMRLPFASGTYTLNVAANTVDGSASTQFSVTSYDLAVLAADQALPQLVNALHALTLSQANEQSARKAAIRAIQHGDFLTAVGALTAISSVDVRSFRVTLDRLIQEQGRQWCTQLPVCGSAESAGSVSSPALPSRRIGQTTPKAAACRVGGQ